MSVILALLPLVLIIVTLADVITREEWQVKHLPKLVWILLVIFLPLVGSILWFAIGRDWGSARVGPSSFDRPRTAAATSERGMSQTERELAALEDEIAADRLRRLEAEVEAKRRAREQ
ncbi:PLD nuclease N-terminal domain-containing protein [Leifsonia sp. H3M29-4]|uniref:PLD nuclease N-terminal domain-containing protein n=1 Tax=Salinibacterium metalliresistens TaxID=3031321 RepID=UPI0023D99EB5|nr:PLD nuclease N-terminal domain-containing protein [Salinibacterium metalliresistens]MDF1479604.1 PLD nuclease N-terminal domain-containing protein [Salinibacterium metalliresistens]